MSLAGFSWSLHGLTNALPCAEEPYLNGSLRHIQHLRDVWLRQIGTVTERQQLTLLSSHIGKCAPKIKHLDAPIWLPRRAIVVLFGVTELVVGPAAVAAEPAERLVAGDLHHPAERRFRLPAGLALAPRAQQRLLHRVLRRQRIPEEPLRLAQAACPRIPPVPSDRTLQLAASYRRRPRYRRLHGDRR